MPRPLPTLPRGPRRPRSPVQRAQLLACPRISPEWELNALRALMKPQLKGAIEHLPAQQDWPADGPARVRQALIASRSITGFQTPMHLPRAGDYFLVAEISPAAVAESRLLALLLSRGLPGVWFVLGRLFVRDSAFYRRGGSRRMQLVRASNVHLPRSLRAALRRWESECGQLRRSNSASHSSGFK